MRSIMRSKRRLMLVAVIGINFLSPFHSSAGTLQYVKDDLDKEWCYLARTTTVIGIPWTAPKPIQITYDGSINTADEELCFFTGKEMKPILIRNRTYLDGWMPMVVDTWQDGDLIYSYEAFATEVKPFGYKNAMIHARLSVRNAGKAIQPVVLTAATRRTGKICRKFTPKNYASIKTTFTMTDHALFRDGNLLYCYSTGANRFQSPGVPYEKPYTVQDAKITMQATTGLVSYEKKLAPGESFSADFTMPRVPVKEKEEQKIVLNLKHDQQSKDFTKYWNDIFAKVPTFSFPEKRVNTSLRCSMVHLMLATRSGGVQSRRQGSGLPYDPLFLNDYFDMRVAYDVFNLPEFTEPNVNWLIKKQHKNGNFVDVHNRGRNDVVTSHCQAMHSLAGHYAMYPDKAYAEKIYPALSKAVAFMEKQCSETKHGLLKDSFPYDNEMILGAYTSHNLLGILGLRYSIVVARALKKEEDVKKWTAFHTRYLKDVKKALEVTHKKYGYASPGLYDYVTGDAARKGFPEHGTDQDWENNLLVYPCEVLEGNDPIVKDTLKTIRHRKYREGVMTYRNGMHIHQYITCNQANQYLIAGDSKHALLDYYHILLHNGSTNEGFENLVVPWSRSVMVSCPPPHAWAASKIALLGRNAMLVEHGGHCGMEQEKRDLHIFNLIAPTWIDKGKQLVIKNAPCEMGMFSATMTFTGKGAQVTLNPQWRWQPRNLVMPVPYFVNVDKVSAKGGKIWQKDGFIRIDPSVTSFEISWSQKPGVHKNTYQDLLATYRSEFDYVGGTKKESYLTREKPEAQLTAEEKAYPATPLSFNLVAKAYSDEYQRRAFLPDMKRYPVESPALLTDKLRSQNFDRVYPPEEISSKSRAFKRPVTSSNNRNAELAVDGRYSDSKLYWSANTARKPVWLMVELTEDLENLVEVSKVNIYTYHDRKRSYQFKVEGSQDGQAWQLLADYSKNTQVAKKTGYEISFKPMRMRYIRVTFMGNSRNKEAHLVEFYVH